jgi:dienelactone hydrolase
LRRRALAGLGALSGCPEVGSAFAAIGFCFGGMAALELARGGAPIAGAVSMHGSLATTSPAKAREVTAKVLVCHGALDPHIPAEDVSRFTREMTEAGADWQLIMYGGAAHGFTHTNAVPGATPGVGYDERADRRAFAAATTFFAEVLT